MGTREFALETSWTQLVASCGASVTIAALIVDPLAQQIVTPFSCRKLAEFEAASIPKTSGFIDQLSTHTGAAMVSFPLGMQIAINAGIFNPGTQEVKYVCPSGKRTFPSEYHTVGYWGSCIDATSELFIQTKLYQPPYNASKL